jgi:sugar phosphate isomerase/epimerase
MKLGNAAWGFRETPLEEQLRITSEMGLSLLELSIGNSPSDPISLEASQAEMDEVKKLFEKYGIEMLCCSTGNDFTGEDANACRESAKSVCKAIDVASALGFKLMRIFAGFSPVAEVTGERWEVMIECICKTADHARTKGVALAVETHGGVEKKSDTECKHFHSTSTEAEALKRLVAEIPDDVGINFDPANLNAVGYEKPEDVYKLIADKVNYMHLKDFAAIPGSDWLKPAACGEGPVDWASLMGAIKDFDGPALIEYENTFDAEDGFKRSLAFLKKFI